MPNDDIASASAIPHGSASDLVAALRDRAPRMAMAVAAGQLAWPAAKTLRSKIRDRAYTVKVPGNDGIYDDLHEWVLSLLPRGEQRALVAWTARHNNMEAVPAGWDDRPGPTALRLRYDGTREQVITVAGHKVRVSVTDDSPIGDDGRPWKPPQIIFTASTAAGRDALLADIAEVVRRNQDRKSKPAFRMLDRWGDWTRLDDLPVRDLDSVILPAGQVERLTGDVGRWLAAEQDYARRCLPWHRGHLYEGPPGTGKTSAARAIASHFGMDVWYLPLADVQKDSSLLRVVNRIGPRSMLLLEDIDVFHAATVRGDDAGTVTLSGLLNTLDGIATPHGLLTVMTTNTPEVLDDAVVRPGRVDLAEHFGPADADQVRRLITRWYDCGTITPGSIPDLAGVIPAQVIEACKRHDDPASAVADLHAAYTTTLLAAAP